MSVPAPIATPTSACMSAGASLIPSPTIATRPRGAAKVGPPSATYLAVSAFFLRGRLLFFVHKVICSHKFDS
jgi:hypothetical protein